MYILLPIYCQCVLLSRYFWSGRDLCIKYQRIVLSTLISESRETKQICTTQSLANCLPGYQWGLNPRTEKDGFAKSPGIRMCFLVNTLRHKLPVPLLGQQLNTVRFGLPTGSRIWWRGQKMQLVSLLQSTASSQWLSHGGKRRKTVWQPMSSTAAWWWQTVYIYSLYLMQQWPFMHKYEDLFLQNITKHLLLGKRFPVLWINDYVIMSYFLSHSTEPSLFRPIWKAGPGVWTKNSPSK